MNTEPSRTDTDGIGMEEKGDGRGIAIKLDELHVLNQSSQSAIEFNEKWISFGGLQALFDNLGTSPTEGIKAEDVSRRQQLFGVNTYPGAAAHGGKPWLTFCQLLWAACTDGKLLIIRVAFFPELILWLLGTGVEMALVSVNDDLEGSSRVLNLAFLTIIPVLFVPVGLVFLIAVKNSKLQASFRSFGEKLHGEGNANVLRSGDVTSVGKDDIVVGDIILLKTGDPIQADGLLIEAHDFSAGSNEEQINVSLGSQSSSISFHLIESGTLVSFGSARFVVTAVGPNTRLGKTSSSTPAPALLVNKLTEEARALSRRIVLTGVAFGGLTVLIMIARFSYSVYLVNKQPWHISHARRLISFITSGVLIFVIVLQKSVPLVIVIAQLLGASMMTKCKLLVKSLDNVQTLGNISVLASFVGKLPEEIDQKFSTAGIRVVTLPKDDSTADGYARYDSISQIQQATIQKLVSDGEIVAVLGQGDGDRPAMERAHLGILLSPKAVSEQTILSAHVIMNDPDKTLVEQLELVLKFINTGRNTYRNICKFIQLFVPAIVLLALTKMLVTVVIVEVTLREVHILWVSFLVFVLGVVFVCETPISDSYFMNCRSGTAKWSLVSKIMLRNMVGQIVYQFVVMLVIHFYADPLFRETSRFYDMYIGTLVFNTISLMTLFNAWNCRLVFGEINIYANLHIPFCIVWSIAVLLQVFTTMLFPFQLAFEVRPLYISELAICYVFAVGTLLWQQLVNIIPVEGLPRKNPAGEPVAMNVLYAPAGDEDKIV